MSLLAMIAWFFGGVFLTNFVPHFVAGVQGRKFQSPFAKPPGVGLSSSRINVVWGFLNLLAGWALLSQVGAFDIRQWSHAAALGAGIFVMGLQLAGYFGRFHGGNE